MRLGERFTWQVLKLKGNVLVFKLNGAYMVSYLATVDIINISLDV